MKPARLTDRQLDVLELALRGLTNQQIGERLFLSLDTVKGHFKRLYAAVQDEAGQPATGALHAVALALNQGALVFDPSSLTIRRPPDRRPLPAYAEQAEPAEPVSRPTAISVQERRQHLGW